MAEYTFYVALQTTGQVVGEIELESAEFTRKLRGGSFRASANFGGLPASTRRDMVELTTPGKYSIVVDRDGLVFGEWLIWTRDRNHGDTTLTISGDEVISHLDQRLLGALSYNGVEQLQIARDLAVSGFAGNGAGVGAIAMQFPAFTPSGRTRIRNYDPVEASHGQRLKELSQVIDGFDYDIETAWTSVGGLRYVQRSFRTYYPRKAKAQPFIFDMGEFGGNGVALTVAEDARNYASQSWAIGGDHPETGQVRASSNAGDVWLGRGFPFRQLSISRTSVKEQATIQAHASAYQALNQVAELPGALTVLADGFPSVMDYSIGDLVLVQADPADSFPDGWGGQMRIQGITLRPNADAGDYELAILELSEASSLPGTELDDDN